MWFGLTRSLKKSQEQSEEENGLVITEDGRFDDEPAEVIIRLPRGSDPAPELVPRTAPMDTGTVSMDADTPDPGQHRRFGPLSGANRNSPCMKCRPCQPRGIAGLRPGQGHSRYTTFVARNRPTWWTL